MLNICHLVSNFAGHFTDGVVHMKVVVVLVVCSLNQCRLVSNFASSAWMPRMKTLFFLLSFRLKDYVMLSFDNGTRLQCVGRMEKNPYIDLSFFSCCSINTNLNFVGFFLST